MSTRIGTAVVKVLSKDRSNGHPGLGTWRGWMECDSEVVRFSTDCNEIEEDARYRIVFERTSLMREQIIEIHQVIEDLSSGSGDEIAYIDNKD